MGERELRVVILGDDRGASRVLNNVERSTDKVGKTSDVAGKSVGALSGFLGKALPGAAGAAAGSLDKIPGSLQKIGGEGAAVGNVLKTGVAAGAVAAGGALLAMAAAGIDKFVSAGAEVRKFKATLGSTAEEASGFRNVAIGLGIDTDAMGKAMQKLATNIFNTGGEFAGLKIEVAQNSDGTTNLVQTVENLRGTYQSIEDPLVKAAFLQQAVGKGGLEVRAALALSNEEWEKFKNQGPILSDKDLADTKAYSMAQRELSVATSELQMNLGKGLVPTLTAVAGAVSDLTAVIDSVAAPVGGLSGIVQGVVSNLLPALGALRAFTGGSDESANAADKAAAAYRMQAAQAAALGVAIPPVEAAEGELTEATKASIEAAQQQADKIEELVGQLGKAQSIYGLTGTAAEALASKQRGTVAAFDASTAAAAQLKAGLDMLIGVHVAADQAAINLEAKVDELTASFQANGATLDINTSQGRTNMTAILDLITGTTNLATSMEQENATTQQVNATFAENVNQLRSVMHQAGFTDAQIDALIQRYNLVPHDVNTQINTPGMGEAHGALAELGSRISSLPDKDINIQARITAAAGGNNQQEFAAGGPVPGYGTGDTVPAWLTPREYVQPVAAVDYYGVGMMEAIRNRTYPRVGFATGGLVQGYATGGSVNIHARVPGTDDIGAWAGAINDITDKKARDIAEQWARDNPQAFTGGVGSGAVGSGWQAVTRYLDSVGQPYGVSSTVRPGAITSSGNLSLHALGRAVDLVGNLSAIFNALLPIAGNLAELIYSGAPFNIKNGQQVARYAIDDHWDHVHAGTYARGGIVPANLHGGEMVLPEWLSSFVQRAAGYASGGMVQAEDGSWVPSSFYGPAPGGPNPNRRSDSWYARQSANTKAAYRPAAGGGWEPKPGSIQAEDGSWVRPSFYSKASPVAEAAPPAVAGALTFNLNIDGRTFARFTTPHTLAELQKMADRGQDLHLTPT